MSEQPVTLELLGHLVRGLQEQMAEFRDQLTVQTAILLRLEGAQITMAEQLRAMTSSTNAQMVGCLHSTSGFRRWRMSGADGGRTRSSPVARRDAAIIATADKAGIAMVFTGIRHFRY